MPRAVKPKIPTIARRHSWPSWARWMALDADGSAWLYSIKPLLSSRWPNWSNRGVLAHRLPRRRSLRPLAWMSSLRRIVPAKARK